MTDKSDVLVALSVVTEGAAAMVTASAPVARAGFGAESFSAEADGMARRSRPWVTGPGIQGVGVGEKITGGQGTGELALRVYVDQKRPEKVIDNAVPSRVTMPALEVPTDVIEIGQLEQELFTDRTRPIVPGTSVSLVGQNPGTLGGFLRKRSTGQLFALSNSHVLADYGRAKRGRSVVQPSDTEPTATGGDIIGTLADFVPFEFDEEGFPNLVDAAIATVDVDHESDIRLLAITPRGLNHRPRVGMQVQKVGRTSDHTIGLITDTDFRLQMQYPTPGGGRGRVGFRNQVLCTRYTSPGDSGSLVLSSSGLAVGLHYAGSPSASVFCRIGDVLDAFDADLVIGGDDAE